MNQFWLLYHCKKKVMLYSQGIDLSCSLLLFHFTLLHVPFLMLGSCVPVRQYKDLQFESYELFAMR